MTMNKRDFLKTSLALPSALITGRLFAAPAAAAGGTRFLFVFLRGGYDTANVVIPTSSDFYYQARPTLAIARAPAPGASADLNAALPLDADWGLHPALRDTLYPYYRKGQVAFVPFAGTNDLSRSHFETQDTIEMGQGLQGTRNYQSGFLNRLAGVLNDNRAIAFSNSLPISFRGSTTVPNVALGGVGKTAIDERQAQLIQAMYRGTPLGQSVERGFDVNKTVFQTLSNEMTAANRDAVSPQGFALSGQRIGKLMRQQFNLGFVDVGGWDTHVNQGGATGYMASRLAELGRGLDAFAQEMQPVWDDTIVVVASEFGRTFRENGDKGTDHGHGTTYWVMGGSVKGGKMLGEQIRVEQPTLFQNRDFPVLNEYRSLLGGIFKHSYGLSDAQLNQVFPGSRASDLRVI